MFVCVCVYMEGTMSVKDQDADNSVYDVSAHRTHALAKASGESWIRKQREQVVVVNDPDIDDEMASDPKLRPMSSFAIWEVKDPNPVFSGPYMTEFVRKAKGRRRRTKVVSEEGKNKKRKSIRSRRRGIRKV